MISSDISAIAGFLSIATWLGAQAPQTIKNYQLQSVDGLSLTFLFNWFMGDSCNLIGCILTDQLPFQTYLACYFVFVDSILLGQYFHYGRREKKRQSIKSALDIEDVGGEASSPLLGHGSRSGSLTRSYASISAIEGGARGRKSSLARGRDVIRTSSPEQLSEINTSKQLEGNDGFDEEVAGAMLASFYSERSVNANTSGGQSKQQSKQKQVGWAPHLEQGSSAPRGRSLDVLDSTRDSNEDQGTGVKFPSYSRSRVRHNRGRSATTTTIVFMGVWALFGFRSYRDGFPPSFSLSSVTVPQGQVLQPLSNPKVLVQETAQLPIFTSQPLLPRPLLFVSNSQSPEMSTMLDGPLTPQPPKEENPGTDRQRIIGRISAWICTTFYLTCRMPQIWKNFMRKSCAGLSPYLFFFAFCGNFFYVISILTSEKAKGPNATAFLLESLPYLIGSGGTLSFDIVILTQAFIYRGRKPRRIQFTQLNAARSYASLVAASRSVSRSRTRERSVSVSQD